ncbi:MAG: HPr kinase/phosphorylase [Paracoccaceae bacterium]
MLIRGASGSGKSTLAVQMIALGCDLVADDRVRLQRIDGQVVASAPRALSGLVEARGIGILMAQVRDRAVLRYVVDLDLPPRARYPETGFTDILGIDVELIGGSGIYGLPSTLMVLLRGGRSLAV